MPTFLFPSESIFRTGRGLMIRLDTSGKTLLGEDKMVEFWLLRWCCDSLESGEPKCRAASFLPLDFLPLLRQLGVGMETWHDIPHSYTVLLSGNPVRQRVFKKDMAGHFLKIFDTRVKMRLIQTLIQPWTYLNIDCIKGISLSLAKWKRKRGTLSLGRDTSLSV